jgi:hypothetical protein
VELSKNSSNYTEPVIDLIVSKLLDRY